MPYCTLDDIRANIPNEHIIQLTDDNGIQQVDIEKVDEAIAYADSLINGYLAGQYNVPLSPVPKLINKLSIDLAIFHLYSRRFDLEMPEGMMSRYKNCIRLLEQIQQGIVRLGIEIEQDSNLRIYEV